MIESMFKEDESTLIHTPIHKIESLAGERLAPAVHMSLRAPREYAS